jgi:hypothetical protein
MAVSIYLYIIIDKSLIVSMYTYYIYVYMLVYSQYDINIIYVNM